MINSLQNWIILKKRLKIIKIKLLNNKMKKFNHQKIKSINYRQSNQNLKLKRQSLKRITLKKQAN